MKIERPNDPYSPAWAEYWRQNPGLLRSVGAAASGDGDGDGGQDGDGGGDGDDPAEKLAKLEQERKDLQDRMSKLEANNRDLLDEKRRAKEAADQAAAEAAKKNGDVEALEKSWQEKLDAERQERERLSGTIQKLTSGQTATKVAAEVFGPHADLMMPHVQSRLTTEFVDGVPKVRVLDEGGNPSAKTPEELADEFRNNERFAPFVVASRASGGGPHGNGSGGGSGQKQMKRSDFDTMTPPQQSHFVNGGGKVVD